MIKISHEDLLGRNLKIGDFVVGPSWGNNLAVYFIMKMTPKMIRVKTPRSNSTHGKSLYPTQVVKLTDEKELTMLLLKEEI